MFCLVLLLCSPLKCPYSHEWCAATWTWPVDVSKLTFGSTICMRILPIQRPLPFRFAYILAHEWPLHWWPDHANRSIRLPLIQRIYHWQIILLLASRCSSIIDAQTPNQSNRKLRKKCKVKYVDFCVFDEFLFVWSNTSRSNWYWSKHKHIVQLNIGQRRHACLRFVACVRRCWFPFVSAY